MGVFDYACLLLTGAWHALHPVRFTGYGVAVGTTPNGTLVG